MNKLYYIIFLILSIFQYKYSIKQTTINTESNYTKTN